MVAQIRSDPTSAELDAAATLLKLLADRTRLHLVWTLLHGEHAVGDLAERVGVAAAAVSQHLAKLRLAGVVTTRRDGNRVFYAAADQTVLRLVTEALFQGDHATGAAGSRHHRRTKTQSP